ncbi:unnamed protein product [Lactuca saligna]|uniref:Long-chain-alcohol oxidase n=1 Tax=Lactuca saligna TaxID=75948 RepID=A0AA35YEA6_LACSI|nr:unnamed protein product [Lactuca saligna]
MYDESASECHPLLQGGRDEEYKTGSFSSSEMETISSICEVIVQPLPLSSLDGHEKKAKESIQSFSTASGSQYPIPNKVAHILVTTAFFEEMLVVKLVTTLLSTRLGTLLLSGFLCISHKWPYIHKFSEISLHKRQKILQKWFKNGYISPIRLGLLLIKSICLLVFFSKVDGKTNNPTWEAIGYHVDLNEEQPKSNPNERPLQKGMVELMNEKDHTHTLVQSLRKKGMDVREDLKEKICRIKCDVVIVGSGCGGGVAAAILAKSGKKVVVLEKGNYFYKTDYSKLEGPSLDQLYESKGVFPTLQGSVMIQAGTGVGGGSAINWSGCIKTPQSVRKEWAEDYNIKLYESHEYTSAMNKVCERIGVTERSGDKKGTDSTWLVDAVDHGAVIITGCKAKKFILARNRQGTKRRHKCLGVIAEALHQETYKTLLIEAKVTISACGSLLTPPLMKSSGLKNPNIGRNLHLHPVAMAWGYFPENETDLTGTNYEGGILTSVHKPGSDENYILEVTALGPGSFAGLCPWLSGQDIKERMMRYSRTAHVFSLIRDSGPGKVKSAGRISFRFSKYDKENMKKGLRQALRVLIAAGAVEVGTQRSDGQKLKCKGTSEEEIEEFLETVEALPGPMSMVERWTLYCSAHQMGSCRMGKSEKEGAVDENGESWEAEGLYVCDASILPTAVGVNPMITIQSTAYCLAERIADGFR